MTSIGEIKPVQQSHYYGRAREITPKELALQQKDHQMRKRKGSNSGEASKQAKPSMPSPATLAPATADPRVRVTSPTPTTPPETVEPPPPAEKKKKGGEQKKKALVKKPRPQKGARESSNDNIDWDTATLDNWRVIQILLEDSLLPTKIESIHKLSFQDQKKGATSTFLEAEVTKAKKDAKGAKAEASDHKAKVDTLKKHSKK
ncbi:hypothetical protein COCNU_01G016190 [Cocos nucifera]|uniref:Uncharacterized protein n=1 Tax=Cocos nucifera TaxID=13894 RepID=A0A8K0MVR0_COCNU|nr:hypothetical protein COCNU_01G016190 [Cocos nucifera]